MDVGKLMHGPLICRMCRDVLDTTLNYAAHVKFVTKWLDKLEAEEKKGSEEPPAAAAPEAAAGEAPAEGAAPALTDSQLGELGRAAEAVQA